MLGDLPSDIVGTIVRHLDPPSLLHVGSSCRCFRAQADDAESWSLWMSKCHYIDECIDQRKSKCLKREYLLMAKDFHQRHKSACISPLLWEILPWQSRVIMCFLLLFMFSSIWDSIDHGSIVWRSRLEFDTAPVIGTISHAAIVCMQSDDEGNVFDATFSQCIDRDADQNDDRMSFWFKPEISYEYSLSDASLCRDLGLKGMVNDDQYSENNGCIVISNQLLPMRNSPHFSSVDDARKLLWALGKLSFIPHVDKIDLQPDFKEEVLVGYKTVVYNATKSPFLLPLYDFDSYWVGLLSTALLCVVILSAVLYPGHGPSVAPSFTHAERGCVYIPCIGKFLFSYQKSLHLIPDDKIKFKSCMAMALLWVVLITCYLIHFFMIRIPPKYLNNGEDLEHEAFLIATGVVDLYQWEWLVVWLASFLGGIGVSYVAFLSYVRLKTVMSVSVYGSSPYVRIEEDSYVTILIRCQNINVYNEKLGIAATAVLKSYCTNREVTTTGDGRTVFSQSTTLVTSLPLSAETKTNNHNDHVDFITSVHLKIPSSYSLQATSSNRNSFPFWTWFIELSLTQERNEWGSLCHREIPILVRERQ